MYRFLYISQEALIAFLLLLPIFRVMNSKHFHDGRLSAFYLVFATYLSAIYAVVGLPDILYFRFGLNVNLEPFLYMFSDLKNTVLNVILFFPLGVFLPLLWQDFRSPWKSILVGFLTSLTVELLQIFTYRATDVNDLITNTAGTLIGFCFGWLLCRILSIPAPGSRRDIPLVFGTAFGVMFFLHPVFSGLIYRLFT